MIAIKERMIQTAVPCPFSLCPRRNAWQEEKKERERERNLRVTITPLRLHIRRLTFPALEH